LTLTFDLLRNNYVIYFPSRLLTTFDLWHKPKGIPRPPAKSLGVGGGRASTQIVSPWLFDFWPVT
jgi:hypothetical protein